MKNQILVFLFSTILCLNAQAQFAPQVGLAGSTAIHKSSSSIKAWAKECTIHRGYLNIADKASGYSSTGDSSSALGIADGMVISLGDSGIATVQFAQSVYNDNGADFVVFENGFQNPANPEEAFLELAFVEVSSDGQHFFRFPATSNTLSSVQIRGTGDYMDARLINNLAGKYAAQYGTPFDLEELKGTAGLDINKVTHIRIIDVVGSIDQYASKDKNGQTINDPYPTPFPTGGFDLDAVGAIHLNSAGIDKPISVQSDIFPNPGSTILMVNLNSSVANDNAEITINDLSGRTLLRQKATRENVINIESLQSGFYLIRLSQSFGSTCIGKFSKI